MLPSRWDSGYFFYKKDASSNSQRCTSHHPTKHGRIPIRVPVWCPVRGSYIPTVAGQNQAACTKSYSRQVKTYQNSAKTQMQTEERIIPASGLWLRYWTASSAKWNVRHQLQWKSIFNFSERKNSIPLSRIRSHLHQNSSANFMSPKAICVFAANSTLSWNFGRSAKRIALTTQISISYRTIILPCPISVKQSRRQ